MDMTTVLMLAGVVVACAIAGSLVGKTLPPTSERQKNRLFYVICAATVMVAVAMLDRWLPLVATLILMGVATFGAGVYFFRKTNEENFGHSASQFVLSGIVNCVPDDCELFSTTIMVMSQDKDGAMNVVFGPPVIMSDEPDAAEHYKVLTQRVIDAINQTNLDSRTDNFCDAGDNRGGRHFA